MKTGVYKYNDPKNQTAWFRGYVYYYAGRTKHEKSCQQVRKTYAEAEKDAVKLKKRELNPKLS